MSALPLPGAVPAPYRVGSSSWVVEWARVIGADANELGFGYDLATNASGEIAVAGRLEDADSEVDTESSRRPIVPLGSLPWSDGGAEVRRLAPDGAVRWGVALRTTPEIHTPMVAIDGSGNTYVLGPYAPEAGAFRAVREVCLTKLGPDGDVEWSRALFDVPLDRGGLSVPEMALAAAPDGGVSVTWIGERGRHRALRAAGIDARGGFTWGHTWPVLSGDVRAPQVGVDAGGATVLWGTFQGAFALGDGVTAESVSAARFLDRIQSNGHVQWAYPIRGSADDPGSFAVGPDGVIGRAHLAVPTGWRAATETPSLGLIRIDEHGRPLSSARGCLQRDAVISSLAVAPMGDGGFALAGYFSGAMRLGGVLIRSAAPKRDALFVARGGAGSDLNGEAFQGPTWGSKLSIHQGAGTTVILAGLFSGTMMLGQKKLVSPDSRVGLFAASLRMS